MLHIGQSLFNVRTIKKGLMCARSIFETIDRKPQINLDEPGSMLIEDNIGDIEFRNVSFTYPGKDKPVLDKVSFTIKQGSTVAIVGPSGSGKSTIAKLLERFYDPLEGNIYVNNEDLKNLSLRNYRQHIGYVGQEPCLFHETINENLLNSNPDATDEEICQALTTSYAFDFVKNLPERLDTNVGAIGGKISGGQKQRIAIARALVRKPDLLIFDEATSALDKESEYHVQRAIDNIQSDKMTKVIIAHRLTTIKNSDEIIVVQQGKIIERGTHRQLMDEAGVYSKMYNMQEKEISIIENIDDKQKDLEMEKDDDLISLIAGDEGLKQEDATLSSFEILKRLSKHNKSKWSIVIVIFSLAFTGGVLILLSPF